MPADEQAATRLPLPADLAALPLIGAVQRDETMDLVYPPGTVLVCVPLSAWPRPLKPGQRVIVEQWRHDFVEVLCREIEESRGDLYLTTRASQPKNRHSDYWRPASAPPAVADAQAGFDLGALAPAPPAWGERKPDGMYVTAIVRFAGRPEPD